MKKLLSVLLAVLICTSYIFINNPTVVYADSTNVKITDDVELNTLLSDFETGIDGWTAGANVASFLRVSSTVNVPNKPYKGSYCGEITSTVCPGTTWRTIYKDISPAMDLSKTPYFVAAVNTYGIGPNDPTFDVRITFYSNTNSISATLIIGPDKWSPIFVNLSDWSYKNNLTRIEISFRSRSYTADWQACHQIDYVGFSSSEAWEFNNDNDFEGWTLDNSLGSGSVTGGYLNTTITGSDPFMVGPANFIADAQQSKYLTIRVKNATSGTQGKIYWQTNLDGTFSESKSKSFTITDNDNIDRKAAIDLSGTSTWANKITRLRIDIPDNSSSGTVSICYIKLNTYPDDVYYGGSVSSIEATSTNILVNGTVNCTSQKTIDLVELQPYEEYNFAAAYTPVATMTVTPTAGAANFQFSIARIDNSKDRIYSKYLVIVNDTDKKKLDTEKYVTVYPSAVNNYSYPVAQSIKGLQVNMVDDAQKLGISHAALNFEVSSMFYLDNSNPANTITYTMDGETFYIKKDYVENFEKSVKNLSDNNILVYVIVLMLKDLRTDSPNQYLRHPDAQDNGTILAINTTDAMGTKYWKAAMEFIAERYSRADQLYGRAVNFIMGNEVDTANDWNNMGYKELSNYVDQYARTFRIAYTAAKKKYSNARIYISLDPYWNKSGVASDPWRYYKGRDVLDGFSARMSEQGNIGWNLAYHAYPENIADPTVWQDVTPTDSFDTQIVNFKNLHILPDYLGQSNYLYNGQMRRIILSEQGFNTVDSTMAKQQEQAAAYAYSYYKAKFTTGIDAFILHRHVDHGQESGLNFGIWFRDTSKTFPSAPGSHKYLYDVFQKIDTSESESVTDFAKSIIGITNWTDVIPGYNSTQLADREKPAVISITKPALIAPTAQVSNFETGNDGWVKCDYASSVNRVSDIANSPTTPYNGSYCLEVADGTDDTIGGSTAEVGIVKNYATPIDMTATPRLQLAVNSYGGCPDATVYNCTIRVYSGTHIAEGKITYTPDQWNNLQMDLSDWAYKNSIDKIKIWFSTDSTTVWLGKQQIDYLGFKN